MLNYVATQAKAINARLLHRIMDTVQPTPYFSKDQEREFMRQLRAKPVRAKRRGNIMLIAPADIGALKQRCDNNGLASCEYAQSLIRYLLDNPKGWLEIHYEIPPHSPTHTPGVPTN